MEGLADGERPAPGAAGVPRDRGRAVRLLHAGARDGRPRPAAPRARRRATARSGRLSRATSAAAPATRRSWTPCAWPRRGRWRRERDAHRGLRGGHGRRGRHRARRGLDHDRGRRASPPSAAAPRRPCRPAPGAWTPAAGWPRPGWSTATTTSTSGPRGGWPRTPTCSTGWSRCTRSGRAIDAEVVHAAARAGLAVLARTRLHDEHGPPLRLPGRRRRPAGRRDRGRGGGGAALPPLPGLHGPRRARAAACRRTRWSRTATRSWPRPRRRSRAGTTRRSSRCCGSPWRRAPRSR